MYISRAITHTCEVTVRWGIPALVFILPGLESLVKG